MKKLFDSARADYRVDDGVEASEIKGKVDEGQSRGSRCVGIRGLTCRLGKHDLTTQGSSHLDALVGPAPTVTTGDADSRNVPYIDK